MKVKLDALRTTRLSHPGSTVRRRGVAAAELAIVLTTLVFICIATCDCARSAYDAVTVANCARNGALYACDSSFASTTPYTSIQQAALADGGNLSPAPTVTSTTGTDASGNNYVTVTVSYPFQGIINYPGIPASFAISRTVRMAVSPP
jgi:Flp pilus assembly protein TadG